MIISADPFACPVRPRTALEIRIAEIICEIETGEIQCRGCGAAKVVLHRLLAALAGGKQNELATSVATIPARSMGMGAAVMARMEEPRQ